MYIYIYMDRAIEAEIKQNDYLYDDDLIDLLKRRVCLYVCVYIYIYMYYIYIYLKSRYLHIYIHVYVYSPHSMCYRCRC